MLVGVQISPDQTRPVLVCSYVMLESGGKGELLIRESKRQGLDQRGGTQRQTCKPNPNPLSSVCATSLGLNSIQPCSVDVALSSSLMGEAS